MATVLIWIVYGVLSGGVFYLIWRQIQRMGLISVSAGPAPVKSLRTVGKKLGLHSDILQEGSGEGAKNLNFLTVQYTAFLDSGQKVDSSYDRGRPFRFKLGVGSVILGWDQALKGMKIGEKRRVTVPAALAYGKKGQNKVPPGANVIFEIELFSIE
ncbi:FKBP-type peptidyl-prolyl cis-trans isomerase [Bdellovibrionota bacterium FG-1]